MKIRKEHKLAFVTILIIVLVSFSYAFLASGRELWSDERDFDTIGQNVAQGHGFSRTRNSSVPMIRRVPLYPLFLALIYRTCGHSLDAVRVVQIFLVPLTALIGYLTARVIFKGKFAFLSLFLIGFWPPLIVFSTRIMYELLNTFLLSLAILCLVMLLRRPSTVLALVCGLLVGVKTLCKPTTVLFPFFVFIFLILVYRSKKKASYHGVMLILAAAIAISPWTVRNYLRFKTFVPLKLGLTPALWVGSEVSMQGKWPGGEKMPHSSFKGKLRGDHLYAEKFYWKKSMKNIRENPTGYLILWVRKAGGFWRRPSVGVVERFGLKKIFIRGSNYLLHYLALTFAVVGSVLLIKRKILPAYPLMLVIVYYTVMYGLLFPEPRYHIPVLPPLLILATYGFARTLARFGPKYRRFLEYFSSE